MTMTWTAGIAVAIGLFFWGYGINRDGTPGGWKPRQTKGLLITLAALLALSAVFALGKFFTLAVICVESAAFTAGLFTGIRK